MYLRQAFKKKSRCLLLDLPPKTSVISAESKRVRGRQEKVTSQFGFGKHSLLLAAWMRAVTSLHVEHMDLSGCYFIPAVNRAEGVFA